MLIKTAAAIFLMPFSLAYAKESSLKKLTRNGCGGLGICATGTFCCDNKMCLPNGNSCPPPAMLKLNVQKQGEVNLLPEGKYKCEGGAPILHLEDNTMECEASKKESTDKKESEGKRESSSKEEKK